MSRAAHRRRGRPRPKATRRRLAVRHQRLDGDAARKLRKWRDAPDH